MKYLKYSLRLLVPLFGFLGLFFLLSYINWSSSDYPVFAGASHYLKMMLEPDILHVVLRNNIPHFLTAVYSSAVLFTLCGVLREKLTRINELLTYSAVWVVSFVSSIFTAIQSGFSYLSYPAFMVTMDASQLQSINLLYSLVLEGVFVSVAVFIVWVVYKLILKYKTAHPSLKPAKNNAAFLTVGTALMCVYVLFHFVNGLIRTLLLLGASDTTGMMHSILRIILNANWLSFATAVIAIIVLAKLILCKQPAKGLYISLIVLSSLVLLRSLTVGNAFNSIYISPLSSNLMFIFRVLTVVFSAISGTLIDMVASVILIVASVRALSQENGEPAPKHRIMNVLSKTLGIVGVVAFVMIFLSVLFGAWITFADGGGGSIGIIGGADGPTALFVTASIFSSFKTHFICCLCLAAASVVFKIISKKQKAEA